MTTRLFRWDKEKVREIKAEKGGFSNEKEMHTLFHKNLGWIFPGHKVLYNEFELDGLRIDTVAFNEDIRSFVIIEYKNVKSESAMVQGMAYLQLLHERRADFFQLYQQAIHNPLEMKDIAWEETKVVVIAPDFTRHQLYAAKRTKDPIELYRITRHEDGIITLERVAEQMSQEEGPESIQHNEKYHLDKAASETKELYAVLKNEIGKVVPGGIEIKPTKTYIKIYADKDDVILCTVQILKKWLNLCYATKTLNLESVDMEKGTAFVEHMMNEDNTPKGKQGLGDYMSKIEVEGDVKKAVSYVKEVYLQKIG